MSELQLLQHSDIKKESVIQELTIASLQTAMSFLLEYFPNTISIYLLEFSGDQTIVGGFGLGVLTTMAFGMGITNGLATGLETLVSQAYGANQYELCAKLYYRSLFLCSLFMIPIGLFLWFSVDILGLINNNTELVNQAGIFNKYMILGVYMNAIFVNTKVFLNGQNVYNFQFYTQLITCAIFIGQSYYLIIICQLGILGCAISYNCLEFLNNLVLFIFIYFSECCTNTMYTFKIQYLQKTVKFLKEAIPIGSILWLEWICFDCYLILASYLDTNQISAHVLMANNAGFFYQFSYGVSIASTTFVGNEMGNFKVEMAKKYSKASFLICLSFLLFSQGLLLIFGKKFYGLLIDDEEVEMTLNQNLFLIVIFCMLDGYLLFLSIGLQAIISGLVRAIGRENSASITFLLCYLVFGEIVGYFLCYHLDLKLIGIWIGMVSGALAYNIIQFINLVWEDWNSLAEKIQVKLASLHHQQISAIGDSED